MFATKRYVRFISMAYYDISVYVHKNRVKEKGYFSDVNFASIYWRQKSTAAFVRPFEPCNTAAR